MSPDILVVKRQMVYLWGCSEALWFFCVWPQKLLNIIAGVLHLGNTQFGEGEEGETYITTETQITNLVKVRKVPLVLLAVKVCKKSHMKALNRCVVVFQLLGVDGSALTEALTHKKLTAKGEEVTLFPVCLSFSAFWWLLLVSLFGVAHICFHYRWSAHWISNRRCLPVTP